MMMQQRGKEPNPDEIPMDFEDLHEDGQLAIYIYGKLGNRIYGDVGFVGKDFTLLPMLVQHLEIIDLDLLIDYLNIIDEFNVDKSQKAIKAEYDKMKNR